MVDAFATADDLAARLNRNFTEDESEWISTLLEDASTYLRDIIGYQVFPVTQATYVAYPDGGRIDLPQAPVVSVDAVERGGEGVRYVYRPGYITVDGDDPVDVTFTFGLAEPPAELTRLACVLVSQALVTLENELGMTAGGLSSVQIDDFKLAWADGGASSGMVLPPIQEQQLRRSWGKADVTMAELR